MSKVIGKFDHLINNLERSPLRDSIFNYKSGRKAFLKLGQENISEWFDKLLPNTRLIIEPKIIGSSIGIQYLNGTINKAINDYSVDITEEVKSQQIIPTSIPIDKKIEIRGVLYEKVNTINKKTQFIDIKKALTKQNEYDFCAFQILHCKINHFQALQELKNLNFDTPKTQLTRFLSDIDIYHQCWKQGKLFKSYPTSGIVLIINSRKLQKLLGENNHSINWAYSLN